MKYVLALFTAVLSLGITAHADIDNFCRTRIVSAAENRALDKLIYGKLTQGLTIRCASEAAPSDIENYETKDDDLTASTFYLPVKCADVFDADHVISYDIFGINVRNEGSPDCSIETLN